MARSTRLVILIKNIYTLSGRKRFLLPVTYFPANLVYPFSLRVTGIIKNKVTISTNLVQQIVCNLVVQVTSNAPTNKHKRSLYNSRNVIPLFSPHICTYVQCTYIRISIFSPVHSGSRAHNK